jgi:DnaK suppressor protein
MDTARATELLRLERHRTEERLADMTAAGRADRTAANQDGDMFDSAQPLTEQGTDESVRTELEQRLAAIGRAEQRVAAGTYGHSLRSGQPISDERLEADPTAELTVEEELQGPSLGK